MTKEDFEDLIKKPTRDLYRLMLANYDWHPHRYGDRYWDELFKQFTNYVHQYDDSPIYPYVEKMGVAYMTVMQWICSAGEREDVTDYRLISLYLEHGKETMKYVMDSLEVGDEVIVKKKNKATFYKIVKDFKPQGIDS